MSPTRSALVVVCTLLAMLGIVLASSRSDGRDPARLVPRTLRDRYGMARPAEIDTARTALVLVDWQEELFRGGLPVPDAPAALGRARALREWAHREGILVIQVDNVGRPGAALFAPGSPGVAIVPELAPRPGELRITKSMGGAFTKTDLDAQLRARGVDTLIVAGLMTHLAVDSTARDATVLGHRVIVVADATATRDLPAADGTLAVDHAALQRAALASLADRWADVATSEGIMALPLVREGVGAAVR